MRAALLVAWPAISYHFGIRPWDTERLSTAEIRQYLDALDDLHDAARG